MIDVSTAKNARNDSGSRGLGLLVFAWGAGGFAVLPEPVPWANTGDATAIVAAHTLIEMSCRMGIRIWRTIG
jgi:hypothetical protein